jgi:hypothetical protein
MLLDAQGKQIEKKMTTGNLVIFVSQDNGVTWKPVKPGDVPAWARHPDVVGQMVAGDMCQDLKKGPEWYRAEKLPVDVH